MSSPSLKKIVDVEMPTPLGVYQLYLFEEKIEGGNVKEHLALVIGDIREKVGVLTRVHSECCTGDVFGCQRCDCQDQLHEAMRIIRKENQGILLYLRQEGRGIGLANKLHAYRLQDQGMDTAEANIQLGFEPDLRSYEIAAEMLNELGVKSVRLLTNNTNKVQGLNDSGINVDERIPLVIHSAIRDRLLLFRTKQQKLGHVFDDLDKRTIVDVVPTSERLPLSYPDLFAAEVLLPQETLDLCEKIKQSCLEKFGDNIQSVLFQGSNMRGDGSLHESDFDYILIFEQETDDVLEGISELKVQHPKCNFLFLTGVEYRSYPEPARLQFFISRTVMGEFDLGLPPGRSALHQTALSYAVQINNTIRPLLFEFLDKTADQDQLVARAHVCLKRVDDCFLRVLSLLKTGKYPLNRSQLLALTTDYATVEILDVLNRWYGGTVTVREVCEALKTAERVLHDFLTHSP
ncbi:GTP cyclohydrolase II [Candidatus Peregrinibacteria bacterium CG10_big_fil_rev_8_21_14_0_10_55_24]|nr:MAG: GTP cyclohydrolase II [Candidatus Peregrinibacteria bacterium CG10_big_fil_rev_8_21_14_0_10_55_24]